MAGTMIIHEDNQATIQLAQFSDKVSQRTKHIDIRYHFLREVIADGQVKLSWIESKNQLADILTKPLQGGTFKFICKQSIMQIQNWRCSVFAKRPSQGKNFSAQFFSGTHSVLTCSHIGHSHPPTSPLTSQKLFTAFLISISILISFVGHSHFFFVTNILPPPPLLLFRSLPFSSSSSTPLPLPSPPLLLFFFLFFFFLFFFFFFLFSVLPLSIGRFSIFFSVSIRAFTLRGGVDYQLTERRIKFKRRIE